jgi:hypothetical protein
MHRPVWVHVDDGLHMHSLDTPGKVDPHGEIKYV